MLSRKPENLGVSIVRTAWAILGSAAGCVRRQLVEARICGIAICGWWLVELEAHGATLDHPQIRLLARLHIDWIAQMRVYGSPA